MYGDVGFFLKKTGRLKGSVHNAMVMSGLTKTGYVEGIDNDEGRMGRSAEGGTVNDVG